jgi:Bacterial protein of unknown function (DUF937)
MASNLISDVMKMASPTLVNSIATSLGINASIVNSVLAMAVPSIFSSVADKAATQTGLNGVMAALNHAKPDFADSLGTALSGGNSGSLISAGTKMLGSMLGGGEVGNLTNAITKSTGANAAATGSLVAIAGQLAMSAFAKQAMGLDGAGVTNLLNSQRGSFRDALPSSLTNILSDTGATVSNTASRATSAATSTANQAASVAKSGTNWLLWLIPLAILAAGLWWFLGHKDMDDKMAPAAETTTTAPAVPAIANIMIDNVDVTKTIGTSLTGLTTALGGITDAASAQTAVAKIQEAATGIDTISGLAAKFSPEQKTVVAGLVNAALPALTASATKAEGIAGAGDILKPVLDVLLGKLGALTK